ncbi:helix-turn-helix transcriptional regulator [Thermomonospora amylolytica]|uniref:helix-turn-helix transcriptional regulator n=1 Tax=Thermomonospora amylolytica TaxID=1411117 RepID=UPI000E6CB8EA|nr:AraC family transcriptional regulator [Thermomonospora amylolytica]
MGAPVDRAVWKRIEGIQGEPLDLMAIRLGRSHYAPHTHAEYAIGACTDGVEVIRYRGERHYSDPGSLVVLEPDEPHTGGPAVDGGMAYRVVYPAGSLLLDGAGQPAERPPHFRDPIIADPGLAERLRQAHRTLTRGDDPLEGEIRLLSVLSDLVHRHATWVRPVPRRDARDCRRIATAVMERLSADITDPPTLAEIATALQMSRYQVLRAFRNAMGMPPYAWLAQYRVHQARLLLERGHRPADAAALTGFADQAHLTRWFRKVLGVTPGAFRTGITPGTPSPSTPASFD